MRKIQVLPDPTALAAAAADIVESSAMESARAGRRFSIALSGGSTPKTLFEMLAEEPRVSRIDWKNWDIYFSDERCVPPDHPDSNFRIARLAMLDHVPINPSNVLRMHGESDPQEAAIEYGRRLKTDFGDGGLDLVLLGMGDDGHTASLFPGTAALSETHHRCVANFVPKLNVWRITMSAPFINRARRVAILVAGAGKAARITQVLDGPKDPTNLPIQLIDPPNGELLWLMDQAAAGQQGRGVSG
jgi:6-phosphogluconolactonase